MIDFQLTPTDEKVLTSAHEQAIIGRRYARYYDKHEDELEPAEFPEAKDLPNPVSLAEEGLSGSSGSRILHSLVMLEIYWGGISLHRSKWGLGNTVLKTVATPEQFEKWKNHTIAIAITEPGAGSDPANIRATATFDRETGEWILNGERIFISKAKSGDDARLLSLFISQDQSRGKLYYITYHAR